MTKGQELYAQGPEGTKNNLHENELFLGKISCGHVECSYDNPAENISTKVPRKCHSKSETDKQRSSPGIPFTFLRKLSV